MSTTRTIHSEFGSRLRGGALELVDEDGVHRVPLLAGSMYYHDLARANWGRCLDALVGLGFGLVDSCVPWSLYEPRRDHFALDDRSLPDLGAFLQACASRSLKVILQLGPLLDIELGNLGLPRWVAQDQRYFALGAYGNPLILPAPGGATALPSVASQAFLSRAELWIEAVARYLAAYRYPAGPLVGVHIGARAGVAGRFGAYDHDYHPEAIAAYRRWLGERYPAGLPSGYGTSAEQADPPRRFDAHRGEDLVVHLDWLEFKEASASAALARLVGAARERGLDGIALLHGLDSADLGLSGDLQRTEQLVDAVGVELAPPRPDACLDRDTALWLQGNSRLPFVWRLAWGNRPWLWVPSSTQQQLESALTALMYGARGASFSMAVARNHWLDAAIDSTGEAEPERYSQLQTLVRTLTDLKWHELQRCASVAVMRVREVERLARCGSLTDPLPPQLLAFLGARVGDLSCDITLGDKRFDLGAVQCWADAVQRELTLRHVPYVLIDSAQSAAQLSRYQLVLVPLFDFVDVPLVLRLREYVTAGGQLVIGPTIPRWDTQGRGLTASDMQLLADRCVPEPTELGELLGALDLSRSIPGDMPELDASLHVPPDQGCEDSVLFLRNPTEAPQRATLEQGSYWDALTGVPLTQQLSLKPRSLQMLRVRPKR